MDGSDALAARFGCLRSIFAIFSESGWETLASAPPKSTSYSPPDSTMPTMAFTPESRNLKPLVVRLRMWPCRPLVEEIEGGLWHFPVGLSEPVGSLGDHPKFGVSFFNSQCALPRELGLATTTVLFEV